MFNPEKGDKTIKVLVVKNCWQYLLENFHKFTDTNKIKVALELCKKDLPTQLEGDVMKQIINIVSNGKSEGLLNRLEGKPETISTNIPV